MDILDELRPTRRTAIAAALLQLLQSENEAVFVPAVGAIYSVVARHLCNQELISVVLVDCLVKIALMLQSKDSMEQVSSLLLSENLQ